MPGQVMGPRQVMDPGQVMGLRQVRRPEILIKRFVMGATAKRVEGP